MGRTAIVLLVLLAASAAGFWFLTAPQTISAGELADAKGDSAKGRYVFFAAGCASCHAAPGAKGDDKLKLSGGLALKTPFGTFYAPNVSPDKEHGIGGWSVAQFVNAVMRGVAPDGRHYYPSFPYMSYQRMKIADVVDLKAFMDTLPAVTNVAPAHDLPPPFRIRRGLGLWKLLFMDYEPFKPIAGASEEVNRGAYLVTGPGHCGECHTPRNIIGGSDSDRAMAGGPDPEGEGTVPNITPHKDGIGSWSNEDIVIALETGLLPDYDTFGGSMTLVQENMAQLTAKDRAAIAAYLKSIPPHPSQRKSSGQTEDPY
ncbi:MAG: c-type cytochrome [Hyphomicrobiaceae bacterium]